MPMIALWWWIDRWRKSTAYTDMTLEEQGAYRNLLDEAQLRGGYLPNDERILAKACGDALAWKRVRKSVLKKFAKTPHGLKNETLLSVIAESRRRSDKQAEYRARLRNESGNGNGNHTHNEARPPISDLQSPISGSDLGSPDPSPEIRSDQLAKEREQASTIKEPSALLISNSENENVVRLAMARSLDRPWQKDGKRH